MNEELVIAYETAAKFLQGYIERGDVRDVDREGWRAAILELRFKASRVKANDPE